MFTDFENVMTKILREIAAAAEIPEAALSEPIPPTLIGVYSKMVGLHRYQQAGKIGQLIFNQWLDTALTVGALKVKFNQLTTKPEYDSLESVLGRAYLQAAEGKGAERHNLSGDLPFERQRMQLISELMDSPDGMVYQVAKKLTEAMTLGTHEARIRELLGVINYAAGIVIFLDKKNAAKYAALEDEIEVPLPKKVHPRQQMFSYFRELADQHGEEAADAFLGIFEADNIEDVPFERFSNGVGADRTVLDFLEALMTAPRTDTPATRVPARSFVGHIHKLKDRFGAEVARAFLIMLGNKKAANVHEDGEIARKSLPFLKLIVK